MWQTLVFMINSWCSWKAPHVPTFIRTLQEHSGLICLLPGRSFQKGSVLKPLQMSLVRSPNVHLLFPENRIKSPIRPRCRFTGFPLRYGATRTKPEPLASEPSKQRTLNANMFVFLSSWWGPNVDVKYFLKMSPFCWGSIVKPFHNISGTFPWWSYNNKTITEPLENVFSSQSGLTKHVQNMSGTLPEPYGDFCLEKLNNSELTWKVQNSWSLEWLNFSHEIKICLLKKFNHQEPQELREKVIQNVMRL